MRRRRQAVALALTALLAGGAGAAVAQLQQEQYLEAVRPLSAGRPEEAAQLLQRFIETSPEHAGAWLDLAISRCELGHGAEAERLFREIEGRFAPPPGILDMISGYRARGCGALAPRRKNQDHALALALGRGHDSNANQGASNRFFSTGSGADLTEWELVPDYLPRADAYTVLSGNYTHALAAAGTLAFVQLRTTVHDTVSEQDATSLMLGLDRPWQSRGWRGRATAALGMVRLGGRLYQRQVQLLLRATPPLALPERLDWALLTGASHVQYPSRSNYDASTLDLGSSIAYAGARSRAQLSLGALQEHGQAGRPGAGRHGWYEGMQLFASLTDRLSGEAGWNRQRWLSQTMYAPGLIDVIRHQDTRQLRAAVLLALGQQHSLQLEWRQVRNRENISLFQYSSRVLQLSWRWDNS